MFTVIIMGFSLSLDAFAVSVGAGVGIPGIRRFHEFRSAIFFSIFQFLMPVAGYYLGATAATYISAFDHWIAFSILAFIGGKMIVSAVKGCPTSDSGDIRDFKALMVLSVATSIDALAVGVSISTMNRNVWSTAVVIGLVTFAMCMAGFEFGKRIGPIFKKGAALIGGMVLAGIGIKILAEHLLTG
jgi:putative Mn2+ efflux pump MntP